ncbi:MAG: cobalt transporter [Clostridiales bacterium]|nr:cobalt transporter [Clostridiales bacterium]
MEHHEQEMEHSHSYTHTHPHEHDHDHHTHDHGDTHEHTHTYTHTHDHGGEPHTHANQEHCAGADCAACGGCEHTPMEELTALMKYMVGHNAAHAQELAGLAKQLEEAGQHVAYEQVMLAVSDFEKGNLRLSAVLQSLNG